MNLMCNTKHGAIEWRWKDSGQPSPEYKSLNHQWWIPKKSEFELVTKVDASIKQEIKGLVCPTSFNLISLIFCYSYHGLLKLLHNIGNKLLLILLVFADSQSFLLSLLFNLCNL